jgi:glycosyltransferase involved in cell wall biosynthesis
MSVDTLSSAVHSSASAALAPSTVLSSSASDHSALKGKRVAMLLFSFYPSDPRPRRAADALLKEGASVDLICLHDENAPSREVLNGINVRRIAIEHRRGGKLAYAWQYFAFIVACAAIVSRRTLTRRYDLVYVHNMPDILVFSGLVPKIMGAKVVLDQHDPMPELMSAIFGVDGDSFYVQVLKRLEKWSFNFADLVLTVNRACERIFAARSCRPGKIGVVMNAPDGLLFPLHAPSATRAGRSPQDSFVIMYHGSLVERNGLDLAVQALVPVLKTVPAAELRIYGKATPFLNRVLDQTASLGLGESVRYFGPKRLEDLAGEIEKCDVGIIPNQRNAFTDINTPTRIFEYLALGKPVIAPSTPGILDYFSEDSLFLFETGDAADLARQIEYVAQNYENAVQAAERGQQIYLQHTWQQERTTLVNLVGALFRGKEARA